MKLVDKDKIAAEINKRIMDAPINYIGHQRVWAYNDVKDILNTLEVKEVELEKEFYDFLDTLIGKDNGHLSEDELFRIAEYFFELGLKTQKGE